MIVELAGIPGSGKTRADRLLARRLRREGRSVVSPTRALAALRAPLRAAVKAACAAGFAASRPAAALSLLAAVRASRQRSGADEISVAVNALLVAWILRRWRRARRRRDPVVILDQGGVQALVSVLASARAAVPLRRRCWEPLLQADACLLLRVDPAEAARRLAERPGRMSRVERLAEGARVAELQRIERWVGDVALAAEARMRIQRVAGGEIGTLDVDREGSR